MKEIKAWQTMWSAGKKNGSGLVFFTASATDNGPSCRTAPLSALMLAQRRAGCELEYDNVGVSACTGIQLGIVFSNKLFFKVCRIAAMQKKQKQTGLGRGKEIFFSTSKGLQTQHLLYAHPGCCSSQLHV